MEPETQTTHYSDPVKGDRGNCGWRARFDKTNGFIGITQTHGEDEGGKLERVLLSPRQYRELVAFAGRPRPGARRRPGERRAG